MKKSVSILLLICIVLSTLSLASCGSIESKNPTRPEYIPEADTSAYDLSSDVYVKVAENENLVFEYNELTTDIRVTVKKTGYQWSTEYNDGSSVLRGDIFSFDYYTTSGSVKTMSSSSDSIEKGQFVKTDIDNGIKVQYGVGDINFKMNFPLAISVERRDSFYEKMNDEQKAMFDYCYRLIDFSDAKYEEYEPAQLDEAKKTYSLAAKGTPWYYMTGRKSQKNVNELNQLWASIGYTQSDLDKDNNGVDVAEIERPEFNLSIYYTLEQNSLKVEIPETEIYYDNDYLIQNIKLHKSFMGFNQNSEGYFLLPDGSGSLMNFNNGKDNKRNEPVYIQMYGIDDSRSIDEKMAYYNDAIFPVFGACYKGAKGSAALNDESKYNGVLAVVNSGDTFTGIEAHSSDGTTENQAWAEFRINEYVKIASFSSSTDGSDDYAKYQFQRYLGNISMSYHFLSGDESTYSGMASYYSDCLFGDKETGVKDYYSTIQTIGTINDTGSFLGISYNKKIALTTFDEVEEIASDLKSNGFNNMNIQMSGWCNGGYEHGKLNKIKLSKQLGDKDDLKKLISDMQNLGVGLYPDVDIQFTYASEKKLKNSEIASTLNGSRSWVCGWYDPVNFYVSTMLARGVMTMDTLKKNIDGFFGDYEEYGLNNISFRSIGSKINANYRQKDFMERQETLENLLGQISGVKDKGYSIMGSGGQAPFVKYLDVINNMPIVSSGFDKCDYSVPFTAMVLSGRVDYTYKPINLSNGEREDLLNIIESASGANFLLTANTYDRIAYTSYDYLYSTVYSEIKDSVIEKYNYISTALEGVYGLRIVKHDILTDGVNKVTFEDGTYIIVNHNDTDYKAGGVTVKANDYAKVKGVVGNE